MIDKNMMVPRYINEAFILPYRKGNLPIGVRKLHHFYIPCMYLGENWKWDSSARYKTPEEAHKAFQKQYAQVLRLLNQYYNFVPRHMYNEDISTAIRLKAEQVEKELEEGRETVK